MLKIIEDFEKVKWKAKENLYEVIEKTCDFAMNTFKNDVPLFELPVKIDPNIINLRFKGIKNGVEEWGL